MNQTGWEEEEAKDRGSNYLGDKEPEKERTEDYNKICGICFSAKWNGFELLPVATVHSRLSQIASG